MARIDATTPNVYKRKETIVGTKRGSIDDNEEVAMIATPLTSTCVVVGGTKHGDDPSTRRIGNGFEDDDGPLPLSWTRKKRARRSSRPTIRPKMYLIFPDVDYYSDDGNPKYDPPRIADGESIITSLNTCQASPSR